MNLVNQPFSDSNEIESQQPEIPKNWYALHVYKNKVSACRDKLNFINKEFEKSEEERNSQIPNELFGGWTAFFLCTLCKAWPCKPARQASCNRKTTHSITLFYSMHE